MKKEGKKRGPKSMLTPEMRRRILKAAEMDCPVEEMAQYCKVHRSTIWEWLKANKELADQVETLRNEPMLEARKTIIKSLKKPEFAFRYAEKKRPDEFGTKTKVDATLAPSFSLIELFKQAKEHAEE